jgi:hypothetical protein
MHELRERLLRSGISPRAVERYIEELQDHREDILIELIAAGLSHEEAERLAMQRLGDVEVLTLPMLTDPRLQSLAARAPLLFWIGLPVMLEAVLVLASVIVVVLTARTGLSAVSLSGVTGMGLFLAPIGLVWCMVELARRRRVRTRLPLVGMALTLALGAAMQVQIFHNEIAVSFALPDLLHLAAYAALAPLPFLMREYRID